MRKTKAGKLDMRTKKGRAIKKAQAARRNGVRVTRKAVKHTHKKDYQEKALEYIISKMDERLVALLDLHKSLRLLIFSILLILVSMFFVK